MHVVVEQGLRRALGGAEEGGALLGRSDPLLGPQTAIPIAPQRFDPAAPRTEFTPLFQGRPLVQPPAAPQLAPLATASAVEETAPALGDLQGRVIGQYRMSYILIDMPGGLRLIDQHAAHECVLYDRYIARAGTQDVVTQQLLTPILYEGGAAETAVLDSHGEELRAVGFEIERFSGKSFAISAIPPDLVRNDIEQFLRKVIDASIEEKSPHVSRAREKVCASLACQAAIKVHRPLGGDEMARLVGDLLASSNPFACPHGRPVIVDIKHIDVERHFHRR
jgi:DNA mismatch repair protein MutL